MHLDGVSAWSLVVLPFLLSCLVASATASTTTTRLTWVNGIGYSEEHMALEAPQLSQLFGGTPIDFYHNPTAMVSDNDVTGYYRDLTQAGTQKLGRITKEVNGLVHHLRTALASVGKNGRVIHLAHSQGVLVTALACKQLLPKEMEQIEVLAFGGAAAIRSTPQTPFARCVNYYSVNDPLLFVVPEAEQALRSGLVAMDKEFCFLAPRIGDPIADHHLLGPTYREALSYEGKRYQQLYQQRLSYRITRSLFLCTMGFVKMMLDGCWQLLSLLKRWLKIVWQQVFVVFFPEPWMLLLQRKRLDDDVTTIVPLPV